MNLEIAQAVFDRFAAGQPVYEATLYKAAELIGVDPVAVLADARFQTARAEAFAKEALSQDEVAYFAVKLGHHPGLLTKLAAAAGEEPISVVQQMLMKLGEGPPPGLVAGESGPVTGAQVQGSPPPAPGTPPQIPAAPGGNLQELLGALQQAHGPQADANGGLPPSGMPPPPPPPPTPEQKIQEVMPDVDAETLERWSTQLAELEQQTQIPITDPAQLQKFLQQVQKNESKIIDEAIKAMGAPEKKTLGAKAQGQGQQGQGQQGQPAAEGVKTAAIRLKLAMLKHALPGQIAYHPSAPHASQDDWRAAYEHPSVVKAFMAAKYDWMHPSVDAAVQKAVHEHVKRRTATKAKEAGIGQHVANFIQRNPNAAGHIGMGAAGAAAGALGGAAMGDKDNRGKSALKGALIGGAVGAGAIPLAERVVGPGMKKIVDSQRTTALVRKVAGANPLVVGGLLGTALGAAGLGVWAHSHNKARKDLGGKSKREIAAEAEIAKQDKLHGDKGSWDRAMAASDIPLAQHAKKHPGQTALLGGTAGAILGAQLGIAGGALFDALRR